jgi:hypothetical protein
MISSHITQNRHHVPGRHLFTVGCEIFLIYLWAEKRTSLEHNIVSFGLNLSSRSGKEGQMSMLEGPLYSLKGYKFVKCSLALSLQEDCNYCITC